MNNANVLEKHEPDYFEHIEMRYGVELEICVKFDTDCLKTTLEEYGLALEKTPLLKRFQIYFLHILAKAPIEIREKYPKIAFLSDKYYIFNLPKKGIRHVGEIDYHEASLEENMLILDYEIPIFMEDVTVVCGDHYFSSEQERLEYKNINTGSGIEINKSIGIECVSPILKFKGVPEITKIKETLLPFLHLIGLVNNKCFLSNKSSGYHVNVSAFDTQTKKTIPITKYPLFLFVLQEFVLKEKKYYTSSFRVEPSIWAEPVYRLIEKMKGKVTNKKNLFNKLSKKGQNIIFPNQSSSLLLNKDYSIRIKQSRNPDLELIEFRVFRSEKHIDILMDHALYALVIVMKGILTGWFKTNDGATNLTNVFHGIEVPLQSGSGTRRRKEKRSRLITSKHRLFRKKIKK
jgi:hypothetical protein